MIVHRTEGSFLARGEAIIPRGTNLLGRLLIDRLGKKLAPRLKCPPCRPDILVDDALSLADFGFTARIVHTPGHSPGSQSVIVDDEIALVGDAMFGIFPRIGLPALCQRRPADGRKLGESCWRPAAGCSSRPMARPTPVSSCRKIMIKGSGWQTPNYFNK